MAINASVTNEQISVSVGETQIDVSVAGGVGPTGAAGSNGAAATVSVGTVTTGAPGSSASVVNAGTSSAAVLNFTIPAGAAGAAGPAGATGAAGTAATVSVGTVTTGSPGSSASVTNAGTSSAAVLNFTIPAGAAGAAGAKGDKGDTGSTGPAGVVSATAPVTYNSSTQTVGLSIGTGLTTSAGSIVVSYGSIAGTACEGSDARLSDSREWSAATVTQADAEAGTSTDRRAFTALRVFQAIAAWWAASAAKTKLDGIASGATANQTDAYLLSRANHTGTQAWSTITSTPTTRAGYGISDAAASSHTHATSDITWQAITGWNAFTAYAAGALVSKDGVAYRAAAAHTSGMSFNPLDWLAVTPLSFPASHIAAGTIDVARLPVGTTSTTVAAGDHTHAQLHDRSHAITSSSDHTATAWRVFYSNGSGVVTELTLGSAGQALLSNGASAAPSWGSAGSNSASDLTAGTLANARLTTRARASMNLYLWSTFR